MTQTPQTWQTYEEVARAVLNDLRKHLGIADITGYKDLPGNSGTSWRVEGTATSTEDGGILIVECREHKSKALTQESVGGLAFRIIDTNGSGGILVTPLPLQKSAKLVAKAQNIKHVMLEPWSTSENYLAEFMGTHFHHVTEHVGILFSEKLTVKVIRDGKVIDEGN